MSRRVVITGMGAITPIGKDVDTFWNEVKKGTIGFAPISAFENKDSRVTMAAEVKDFDAKEYMDPKKARRMERFCQFAVAAAGQALSDAKLDMEKEDPYRVGCSISSGIGSMQCMEREHTHQMEKGQERVSPLMVPLLISNMAAGNVAICQDDWETFSIMRRSQYETWPAELLESYLNDLLAAKAEGRNLITEKYGRMMESTAPAEYAKIRDALPALDANQVRIHR